MCFYWLSLKLPSTTEARRSSLLGSKKTKRLKTETLVFLLIDDCLASIRFLFVLSDLC
ncbi:hypothetical protein INR49_004461 [Caranx melampygus]|nr:hypothetical protein INR49_004461 [Caranx melampygus]